MHPSGQLAVLQGLGDFHIAASPDLPRCVRQADPLQHRQPHRRSKSGSVTPRHAVDDDNVSVIERAPYQGPHPVPVLLPSIGVGDGEVLHVSPGQGHTLPLGQPLREANHLEAACWKGCGRDCRGDAPKRGLLLARCCRSAMGSVPFAVSWVQTQALRDLQEVARELGWFCRAPGIHRGRNFADLRILDLHNAVGCCGLAELLGRRSG